MFDRYAKECLRLASMSKGQMKFGAVLVKGTKIVGRGYNKRSTAEERKILSHVDYSTHAEQLSLINGLENIGDISGCRLYVTGYVKKKGQKIFSLRHGKYFTCRKCPHSLIRYNIPVYVATEEGWVKLTPQEALKSAKQHKGYWQKVVKTL